MLEKYSGVRRTRLPAAARPDGDPLRLRAPPRGQTMKGDGETKVPPPGASFSLETPGAAAFMRKIARLRKILLFGKLRDAMLRAKTPENFYEKPLAFSIKW